MGLLGPVPEKLLEQFCVVLGSRIRSREEGVVDFAVAHWNSATPITLRQDRLILPGLDIKYS